MATLRKIQLGAFPEGEIPFPIRHQYLTHTKAVIDISGWDVLGFYVEGPDGPKVMDGPPVISDGPNGEVTYTWGENDMILAGDYSGLMWVQDVVSNPPNVRLASDLFMWTVVDGPGPIPPDVP